MNKFINRMQRLAAATLALTTIGLVNVLGSLRQFDARHQQGELNEYCQLETYDPECWKNEVIAIDEAIYGRRHIGKCIPPGDVASEFADDSRFLGCSADVLHLLDAKCSGRKQCQVRIPDAQLEQTKPCLKDLKMFLEVRHHCVEVVEPDRSCVVSVTSTPQHIAAAAAAAGEASLSTQSNTGCGTKTQPWMLEAPAGQRINISLLDFTAAALSTSQHLSRSTSLSSSSSRISGSCVDESHQYGYIIDKSSVNNNNNNVSVCHAPSNRQTHIYLSASNLVRVALTGSSDANFLLRIEAVGCTNLVPPEDAWIKREDDKIVIGCYTSRQTWQLRCHDGRWTGVVSNCTKPTFRGVAGSMQVKQKNISMGSNAGVLAEHQVAAVIAVGFVGLAVCLTIICCGVVCIRRFQSQYNADKKMFEKCQPNYNFVHLNERQEGASNCTLPLHVHA